LCWDLQTVGRDKQQSLKDLNKRLKHCALANGSSPPATPMREPGSFARCTPSPAIDIIGPHGPHVHVPGGPVNMASSSVVRLCSGQKIDGITVTTLRHSHPLLI
jgi:hypothetical protein